MLSIYNLSSIPAEKRLLTFFICVLFFVMLYFIDVIYGKYQDTKKKTYFILLVFFGIYAIGSSIVILIYLGI